MGVSWSMGAWIPVLRRVPGADSVALTIDDAPMPDTTPALLDLLESHGAMATFFLSGCRMEGHLALVADIIRRGHPVYAHGWDHIRLDKAGPVRLVDDMTRAESLLSGFRPTPSPYLVRLPQNGGYRNARIHRTLAQWKPGCQFAHWGTSTEDHLISTRCTDAGDVVRQCGIEVDRLMADPRLPGSILLMHDQPINERPGAIHKPAVTVTLMRLLLEGLAAKGLKTAPLQPLSAQPWWTRFMLV
ncbi:polysaccharide deacetylase family protein [Magnetospirillum sp. LM-5]|uniref:polysaccharide deacetylase family protein n=1 Tax=Magnetospirillum sp. LM-5 TaxID=2681466 RepID=UPI0020C2D56B|nr:polysaccharide deacetylase family protein [Magnetospirillum sp. LM-5]